MVKADRVILVDEGDVARVMRALYHDRCTDRVHILICVCGQQADLRKSPKAWNGWQILPHAVCPQCIDLGLWQAVEMYPSQARERFMQQIRQSGIEVNPAELFALIDSNANGGGEA